MTKPEPINDEGVTFTEWRDAADRFVASKVGLGLDDLPDSCTYDAWFDCVSPQEHATEVLLNEGVIA